MGLTAASLDWLRAMDDDTLARRDASHGELLDAALAVVRMASQTPAWTQPFCALLERLIGVADARSTSAAIRTAWPRPPVATCPQVVDVDFPTLALSRAEWHRGSLFLTLAPASPDPSLTTQFRVVGVEPRVWWQTGIDGATTDVRSDAVVVRSPLVAGDLEFVPGSY